MDKIIALILMIIIIILSLFNIFQFISIKKIKTQKRIETAQETKEKEQLLSDIENLNNKRENLIEKNKDIEESYQQRITTIEQDIQHQQKICKENMNYATEQYLYHLEQSYLEAEQKHDQSISQFKLKEKELNQEIEELKSSLNAGVQAKLREKEKLEKINFYKLNVSDKELFDIQSLNQIKPSLSQPVILNKLIWTTYFQKQTTELCNKVLGVSPVCGIYKITNLTTDQCYIGQSVNCQDRWKQHIKCGLGIDASATNKLYQAMQANGIWNFTFELLEKCSREKLNEKERFWIELYQSDKFGYNLTKGNK